MFPSKKPVSLYWQVVDHFLQRPGAWRFVETAWHVASATPTRKRLILIATITAGRHFRTGRFTMAARVQVRGGESVSFSRSAVRELDQAGVTGLLRQHGFRWRDEPLGSIPLNAWHSIAPRTFASERVFLSRLANRSSGAVGRVVPRSLRELLGAFRGRRAGDWRPFNAQWELRKPIRISGRPATASCMVHLAPLVGSLGLASTITIWPPWNGRGALPAWLSEEQERLDSQYRALGHDAAWHRGPQGRGVMVTSMREDLRGLADVVRERRTLEAAHLGDLA